jgi:hypothetical protein
MRTLADCSRSIVPRPRPSVALAVSWVTTLMPNCQVNFTASWTPMRMAAIITWTAASREMSRAVQTAPGPYEDAVQDMPIFEENAPDDFKGVDIMRAVRSFDPCLPCGVHMYLGGGRTLRRTHSPILGPQAEG